MLERIQDNWRMLKDKLEIDIVEKHSYIARFLVIVLMGKNNSVRVMYWYIVCNKDDINIIDV